MLDVKLIERALKKTGKSKGGLADAMGVRAGAVSEILSGVRLIKASEIAPIIEYLELNSVPIMKWMAACARGSNEANARIKLVPPTRAHNRACTETA